MVATTRETEECAREAQSLAPSAAGAVKGSKVHRRVDEADASTQKGDRREGQTAKSQGGRPHKRWRIRVVRIDAEKYPEFARDKDHPFAGMAPEARVEEIDVFFARLRARRKNLKPASDGLSAAA